MNKSLFENHPSGKAFLYRIFHDKEFSSRPFKPMSDIFLFLGLDFDISSKSKLKERLLCIFNKISIINVCLTVVFLVPSLYSLKDTSGERIKTKLSTCFAEFSAVLLWCTLYNLRRKIGKVIYEITKLEKKIKILPSGKSGKLCIMWVFSVFIASYFCFLLPYEEERYAKIVQYYTFELVNYNNQISFYISVFIYFIYNIYYAVLPASFIGLYIVLCLHLKSALCKHIKMNERILVAREITPENAEICRDRYNTVLLVLRQFEEVMCFPIFIVLSNSIQGIFNGLMLFFKPVHRSFMTVNGSIFHTVHSFVCFAVISLSASSVHEKDELARYSNDQVLQRTICGGIIYLNKKIAYLFSNSGPPFSLTCWKFFEFKRGFFPSAIGCILTYALLIISL